MDLNKVKGIIPPIITPLNEKEEVDEGAFRKLLNHCYEVGIHGIFVAGTNGECMALTQKERNRAIQIPLDEVGEKMPVMAGVMDTSTKRVIENIKALEQMGGEIAVVNSGFLLESALRFRGHPSFRRSCQKHKDFGFCLQHSALHRQQSQQ